MKIFFDSAIMQLNNTQTVATLGTFDGVHLGHRSIISKLVDESRRFSLPSVAITFATHPRLALGETPPPYITSLDKRLELMSDLGLDFVWLLNFDQKIAKLSAEDFSKQYLYRRLKAKSVVLGETANFGRLRQGNATFLRNLGHSWGMEVITMPSLNCNDSIISSTNIRHSILSGDLQLAKEMLGRNFSIIGTVIKGQQLGRVLGYPTINFDPHHSLRLPDGVYLSLSKINNKHLPSVTSIGRPPTEKEISAGVSEKLIETHIFNFSDDIYGSVVEVIFLSKIRDFIKLNSLEELKSKIDGDISIAKDFFSSYPIPSA